MLDSELNAAAAQHVMGWTVDEPPAGHRPYYCDASGELVQDALEWQPCADIAQAWMLVEKLRADGWALRLHAPGSRFADIGWFGKRWVANFDRHADGSMVQAEADTETRAIVLAALRALGVEVKDAN